MSKALVRAKPFVKKRKALSLKRVLGKAAKKTGVRLPSFSLQMSKRTQSLLSWMSIGAILLFCLVTFLIKGVLLQPKFEITNIKFSQRTLETYEDIDLFNEVFRQVKGKNFFLLKWFHQQELLAALQERFPQIAAIQIQLEVDQAPSDTPEHASASLAEQLLAQTAEKKLTQHIKKRSQTTTGGILGVEISFQDPLFVVKLGDKKF